MTTKKLSKDINNQTVELLQKLLAIQVENWSIIHVKKNFKHASKPELIQSFIQKKFLIIDNETRASFPSTTFLSMNEEKTAGKSTSKASHWR